MAYLFTFHVYYNISDLSLSLSHLQISACKIARRTNNYNLAENLIREQLTSESTQTLFDVLSDDNLTNLPHCVSVLKEGAKLLAATGKQQDAMNIMLSAVQKQVVRDLPKADIAQCQELQSRAILNVVKWLQADSKYLSEVVCGFKESDDNFSKTTSSMLKYVLASENRQESVPCKVQLGDIAGGKL